MTEKKTEDRAARKAHPRRRDELKAAQGAVLEATKEHDEANLELEAAEKADAAATTSEEIGEGQRRVSVSRRLVANARKKLDEALAALDRQKKVARYAAAMAGADDQGACEELRKRAAAIVEAEREVARLREEARAFVENQHAALSEAQALAGELEMPAPEAEPIPPNVIGFFSVLERDAQGVSGYDPEVLVSGTVPVGFFVQDLALWPIEEQIEAVSKNRYLAGRRAAFERRAAARQALKNAADPREELKRARALEEAAGVLVRRHRYLMRNRPQELSGDELDRASKMRSEARAIHERIGPQAFDVSPDAAAARELAGVG